MWNLNFDEGLDIEWMQAMDEGRELPVEMLEAFAEVSALPTGESSRAARAAALMDAVQSLPIRKDFSYDEPDDLTMIRASRPAECAACVPVAPDFDRIYGAWLGRAAGCLLGNPVEGWRRNRILGFLRDTGNLPIRHYLSSNVGEDVRERHRVVDAGRVYSSRSLNWINNVRCMPEDDDTNYTALALVLLEDYGKNFTSTDVATCWMQHLPMLHTYTAERAALRAFAHGVLPPDSAVFRNPYREWIGAAIRTDFYGYIAPGNPALAAEFAWRDARISHVKNGVYYAMWVSAALAAAAVESEARAVIEMGLAQVPAKCRFAEAMRHVMDWRDEGIDAECALDRIHARYSDESGHDAVHAISNAMIVAVALLWGEGDLGKTIGLAVQGALDTDCNGATAGSIIGMMHGAKALDPKWIEPLHDQVRTRVDAMGYAKIFDLAERTVRIAGDCGASM